MPGATTPTPVVVMKTPSPLPRSTTLVSPVTIGTPASLAAVAILCTIRARSASLKPSSRIKPAANHKGWAPIIATSLIVPCTDRQPISPPGKNSGETTWQSVAMTSLPVPGAGKSAPSSPWARYSLPRHLANSSSISCAMARPPEPWAMSTWPFLMSRGRM